MGAACSAENREKLQKQAMGLMPGKKPKDGAKDGEKEPLQDAAGSAKEDATDAAKTDDSNPLAALGIDTSALGDLGDLGNLKDVLGQEGVGDLLTQAQDILKGAEKETGSTENDNTADKENSDSAANRAAGEKTDGKDGAMNIASILGNKDLKEALNGVDLEDPEKLKEVMENDSVKKVMGNLKGADSGAALKTFQGLFDKLPDNITSLIPGSSSSKPGDTAEAGTEDAANQAADLVNQGMDAIGKLTGDDKK